MSDATAILEGPTLNFYDAATHYLAACPSHLRFYRDEWYEWTGSHWRHLPDDRPILSMTEFLRGVRLRETTPRGIIETRANPTDADCRNVLRNIKTSCLVDADEPHSSVHPRPPSHIIPLLDCLVDVRSSTPGNWVTLPHDPATFFSLHNLPYTLEHLQSAPEPTSWRSAMHDWSVGDPLWQDLREEYFGAALMPVRPFKKILLEYGAPQSGKGMGISVLQELLAPNGYAAASPLRFCGDFGLQTAHGARCLFMLEGDNTPSRQDRAKIAGLLKILLESARLDIPRKYKSNLSRISFNPAVIYQANSPDSLPDHNGDLLAKVLPLYFERSYAVGGDLHLGTRLQAEKPGIARRLVDACIRLAGREWEFQLPESSKREMANLQSKSNAAMGFLNANFVHAPGRSVSYDRVREAYKRYVEAGGDEITDVKGRPVAVRNVPTALIRAAAVLNLESVRRKRAVGDGVERWREIRGLAPRRSKA